MATEVLEPTVTATKVTPWTNVILGSTSEPHRMTWKAVYQVLKSFSSLIDDWDGQGAAAPSPEIIALARDFAATAQQQWPEPAHVRVTPDGCISFEWTRDSELVLEAEISAATIEYIVSAPGMSTRSYFEPVA